MEEENNLKELEDKKSAGEFTSSPPIATPDRLIMRDQAKANSISKQTKVKITGTPTDVSIVLSNPLNPTWQALPSQSKHQKKTHALKGDMSGQSQYSEETQDTGIDITLQEETTVDKEPHIWNIPDTKNRVFISRKDNSDLDPLASSLETSGLGIISGFSGMGKTRLAKEYANQSKLSYKLGYWLQGNQLDHAYLALAQEINAKWEELGLKKEFIVPDRPEKIREKVKEALQHIPDWLLIFDSIEGDTKKINEFIRNYLPSQAGPGDLYVMSKLPDKNSLLKYKKSYIFIKTVPPKLFHIDDESTAKRLKIESNMFQRITDLEDLNELMPLREQVAGGILDGLWEIITRNKGYSAAKKHVIITSRNPSWIQYKTSVIPLHSFSTTDSLQAFQINPNLPVEEETAAKELAEKYLFNLPLAVIQTAAYMGESQISFRECLKSYKDAAQRRKTINSEEDILVDYEGTVCTVFRLSMAEIKKNNLDIYPIAEKLMNLCAYLAPNTIPRIKLQEYLTKDVLQFNNAIGCLTVKALIEIDSKAQASNLIALHPLTQDAIRLSHLDIPVDSTSLNNSQVWVTAAAQFVNTLILDDDKTMVSNLRSNDTQLTEGVIFMVQAPMVLNNYRELEQQLALDLILKLHMCQTSWHDALGLQQTLQQLLQVCCGWDLDPKHATKFVQLSGAGYQGYQLLQDMNFSRFKQITLQALQMLKQLVSLMQQQGIISNINDLLEKFSPPDLVVPAPLLPPPMRPLIESLLEGSDENVSQTAPQIAADPSNYIQQGFKVLFTFFPKLEMQKYLSKIFNGETIPGLESDNAFKEMQTFFKLINPIFQQAGPEEQLKLTINWAIMQGNYGKPLVKKRLLEAALDKAQKLYKNKPQPIVASILASLGDAHGELGNYPEQEQLLTRALAIGIDGHLEEIFIFLSLAYTYLKLNKPEDALTKYKLVHNIIEKNIIEKPEIPLAMKNLNAWINGIIELWERSNAATEEVITLADTLEKEIKLKPIVGASQENLNPFSSLLSLPENSTAAGLMNFLVKYNQEETQSESNNYAYWFTDEDIEQLFDYFITGTKREKVFAPVSPLLNDRSQEDLFQTIVTDAITKSIESNDSIFIPVNLIDNPDDWQSSRNQWVLLVVKAQRSAPSFPALRYIDPFGTTEIEDLKFRSTSIDFSQINKIYDKPKQLERLLKLIKEVTVEGNPIVPSIHISSLSQINDSRYSGITLWADIKALLKGDDLLFSPELIPLNTHLFQLYAEGIKLLHGNQSSKQIIDKIFGDFDQAMELLVDNQEAIERDPEKLVYEKPTENMDKKGDIQQTVSNNPTAVGIPHKAPSALSRKGLSAKGKLSQQQLIETLPQDKTWDFGEAIDNGDCFYDAIAQSLHVRAMNSTHTIKSLRVMCSDYIHQLNAQSPQANWVKTAIEKDKGIDDYQTHLTSVQFTAEEMTSLKQESIFTGYAIWGKPHIEGKILAQQLNISLHIIEFHEAESGMEAMPPMHTLVTKDKVSQVEGESIHYQDEQIIHLAVCRNHFVPILPSHYLKQQQSNLESRKLELTQFGKHSHKTQGDQKGNQTEASAYRLGNLMGQHSAIYKKTDKNQDSTKDDFAFKQAVQESLEKYKRQVEKEQAQILQNAIELEEKAKQELEKKNLHTPSIANIRNELEEFADSQEYTGNVASEEEGEEEGYDSSTLSKP